MLGKVMTILILSYERNTYMQTNTFNMLLVWSKVFVLFVELFPSTGVLWVIGVRLHISILLMKMAVMSNSQALLIPRLCFTPANRIWLNYWPK